jgi:uncharacterized protein (TIGR03437 family)
MERKRKLSIAKVSVLVAVIPILLWAHEYGPDPGYCGVPNENGGASGTTCANSQCHLGTANNPANKGGVTVNFPSGLTYIPGVTQHLAVTIADPAPNQAAWGFQLTARVAGTPTSTAGTLASTSALTQVVCAQTNLFIFQPAAPNCPANEPLQYVEHTLAGYTDSRGHTGSYTYLFDWTPPSSNVGNVTIYVAANAATLAPVSNGNPNPNDHIYSTTYTLTASAASPPVIDGTQVFNAASYAPGVVPQSWLTIKGSNLSPVTDTWDNAIVNGNLPSKLDGVSVSVGGQPAYVWYISPGQINVVTGEIGTGSVTVTVTNPAGTSPGVTATSAAYQPAFFQWGTYAVATRQDYSWAVKNGTFAGTATVPAKPGDVLILWGTGFGPTNPPAPVGQQVPGGNTFYYTASPVTVTVGGSPATVYYALLAPGNAALYQVAIQVPPTLADGDYPIVATISGASSPAGTLLTVAK